jgi:nicotinate-nucleotide adenylyltransferase
MEFFRKAGGGPPRRVAIFAGAFHPPTLAHRRLIDLALAQVDEVLVALPRVFPHKDWAGADLPQRLAWVLAAVEDAERCSVAAADRGLFLDLAREARAVYGPEPKMYALVGRDAAERIANWDYRGLPPFEEQLREFELLVAARRGEFQPPPPIRDKVHRLELEPGYQEISSTEIRRRIRAGEPWEHLVPARCAPLIRAAQDVFTSSACEA